MKNTRLPPPPSFRYSFVAAYLIFSFLIFFSNLVTATTIPLSEIPIGKVVSVNGLKFIKIAENQYLAAEPFGTMQAWSGCAALPNPACMAAGTCTTTTTKSQLFTQGPILMDARDGKKYEIRKFPDGKCWMVDNLRYGGTTDACSGKTTFSGNGAAAASNRFGANTYGDCRDAKIGAPSGTPCYNTTACGYYYNWQAAMQASGAYYNVSYTTPSYPWQGICPDGWHLPRGGTDDSSEFITLDKAVGGTGANSQTGANYVNFWKVTINNVITSTDPWKGVLAGASINNSGGLIDQSLYGNWWSSTESSATNTYCLYIYSSNMHPQYNVNNNDGRSLRCIKD